MGSWFSRVEGYAIMKQSPTTYDYGIATGLQSLLPMPGFLFGSTSTCLLYYVQECASMMGIYTRL